MKTTTYIHHVFATTIVFSLLNPVPTKCLSSEDLKTIGLGIVYGGAITTCLRDTIASNQTVKDVAHTINMSAEDLVLSAFYASVLAGAGTYVQSPVIKTGLFASAILPFITGICMPKKVSDWVGKLPFVRNIAKPLSKHSWLTLVSCTNKECSGFCETCKVQRMYQGTLVGGIIGLGVGLIQHLRSERIQRIARQRQQHEEALRRYQEALRNQQHARQQPIFNNDLLNAMFNELNNELIQIQRRQVHEENVPDNVNALARDNRDEHGNPRECPICYDAHRHVIQICQNRGEEGNHAVCRNCVQHLFNPPADSGRAPAGRCPLCNAVTNMRLGALMAAEDLSDSDSDTE